MLRVESWWLEVILKFYSEWTLGSMSCSRSCCDAICRVNGDVLSDQSASFAGAENMQRTDGFDV